MTESPQIMPQFRPAIYQGTVTHARLLPFRHRFAYRVFALWMPLDDLEKLSANSRIFGYRRGRLLQFCDRDHGRRDGAPLRPWLGQILAAEGINMPDGPVMVLCYPRILGYVFNPLTLYCLYHPDGGLGAVVYEVKNTFGEQHCYVMAVPPEMAVRRLVHQQCDKMFYVSPFLPLAGGYRFRLQQPDDRFSLLIRQFSAPADGANAAEQMVATFVGTRLDWSDAALVRVWLKHPLMTLKVMASIHWQALLLWRKGAQFFRRAPHQLSTTTGVTTNMTPD